MYCCGLLWSPPASGPQTIYVNLDGSLGLAVTGDPALSQVVSVFFSIPHKMNGTETNYMWQYQDGIQLISDSLTIKYNISCKTPLV